MGFDSPDNDAQAEIDEQKKAEEAQRKREQLSRQQGRASTMLTGAQGVGDTSTAVRRKQLTGQ